MSSHLFYISVVGQRDSTRKKQDYAMCSLYCEKQLL